MAETKALTFSLSPVANSVSVVLHEGAPWEQGSELGKAEAVLWEGSGLTEQNVRDGILEDNPSPATLKKAGAYLGKLLLGGTIATEWEKNGAGVRCYLQVDSTLDWIPWETAIDPATKQPLFINPNTPFVRYGKPGKTIKRPKVDRLVMLVVVSVRDWEAIGATRELRLLREAIRPVDRLVEMVVLPNPSREKIFTAIRDRKPAILHFIGHGDTAELKLWADGKNEPWSREDIGNDLDNAEWAPNFVFLNACHSLTGAAPTGHTGRTWSIAGVFLEKGVSAVLAMQGPISGEAAGLLAQEFYAAVAQGEGVDTALTRGRNRLLLHATHGKTREPYFAALVVNTSTDELLAYTSCRDQDYWIDQRIYRGLVSNCTPLIPAVNQFVDRDQYRWDLLDQLDHAVDPKPASLVTGPEGIGKTWLLAWCIDGWLRRRYRVQYVRMSGCADWLEFIRTLRDGRPEPGVVHEALSQVAKNFLNWRLPHLAKGTTRKPQGAMPASVPPEKIDLKKAQRQAPDFHVYAFAALAEALMLDAGQNPVVLVLDDFDDGTNRFSSPHLELLMTHFVKAQILARPSRIRVVLSISDRELLAYPVLQLSSIPRVPLPPFSEDQADHIRLAYKLRYQAELPDFGERDLPNLSKKPRTGAELAMLCKKIYDYAQEQP